MPVTRIKRSQLCTASVWRTLRPKNARKRLQAMFFNPRFKPLKTEVTVEIQWFPKLVTRECSVRVLVCFQWTCAGKQVPKKLLGKANTFTSISIAIKKNQPPNKEQKTILSKNFARSVISPSLFPLHLYSAWRRGLNTGTNNPFALMHIKDYTYQSLWVSTSKRLRAAAVLIHIHVGRCRSQQKAFHVTVWAH